MKPRGEAGGTLTAWLGLGGLGPQWPLMASKGVRPAGPRRPRLCRALGMPQLRSVRTETLGLSGSHPSGGDAGVPREHSIVGHRAHHPDSQMGSGATEPHHCMALG